MTGFRSLQLIRNHAVLNRTAFGHAFQQNCRRSEVFSALPGYGFLDGGCLSLALAVRETLGGDRARIRFVGREARPDHAIVELKAGAQFLYLDADGLGTASDLRRKMARLEGLAGLIAIQDFTVEEAVSFNVIDGENASVRLLPHLEAFFASWSDPTGWLALRDQAVLDRHLRLIRRGETSEMEPDELEATLMEGQAPRL